MSASQYSALPVVRGASSLVSQLRTVARCTRRARAAAALALASVLGIAAVADGAIVVDASQWAAGRYVHVTGSGELNITLSSEYVGSGLFEWSVVVNSVALDGTFSGAPAIYYVGTSATNPIEANVLFDTATGSSAIVNLQTTSLSDQVKVGGDGAIYVMVGDPGGKDDTDITDLSWNMGSSVHLYLTGDAQGVGDVMLPLDAPFTSSPGGSPITDTSAVEAEIRGTPYEIYLDLTPYVFDQNTWLYSYP